MITFGVVSGVSIGTLFIAGFVPAILMIVTLSLVMIIKARGLGYGTIPFSFRVLFRSFFRSILAILMPVIILGVIYGGIFTPTESAAVAIVYALIVSMLIYREISWKGFSSHYYLCWSKHGCSHVCHRRLRCLLLAAGL